MNNFNIAKDFCTCLYSYRIPMGAMYGRDSLGVWICQDYRVYTDFGQQRHYYKVKRAYNADITLYETVKKRPRKLEKTRYNINVWKSAIIFLDTSTGSGISKVINKYHPNVTFYSETQSQKNNVVQFVDRHPTYKVHRNPIPDGHKSGTVFVGKRDPLRFWKEEKESLC